MNRIDGLIDQDEKKKFKDAAALIINQLADEAFNEKDVVAYLINVLRKEVI